MCLSEDKYCIRYYWYFLWTGNITLCFFSNQSKSKLKPLTSNQNSVILFCFIVA